jgi:hypothetical protein
MQIYIIFTSALVGGNWSASRLGRFIPAERAADTRWIGGWVELPGQKEQKQILKRLIN